MLKKLLLFIFPVGLILFLGSHLYDYFQPMPDFTRGFFDGLSCTFMAVGLVFLVWYFFKNRSK